MSTDKSLEELTSLGQALDAAVLRLASESVTEPIGRLLKAAEEVGRAWSGSALGYHSRVYHEGLTPPSPGERFSREWGFIGTFAPDLTVGEWREYDYDEVIAQIEERAGRPDFSAAADAMKEATSVFEDSKAAAVSVLRHEGEGDQYLDAVRGKMESLQIYEPQQLAGATLPQGQIMTRDGAALNGGLQVAPHIAQQTRVLTIRSAEQSCRELATLCRRASSHIERGQHRSSGRTTVAATGTAFIGHGGSRVWKDLKDFLQDRLQLQWDEFNRVPVAGQTNIQRLSEMLDDATIAFLVLTAEDEQTDGTTHARQNVIHEAGLFQGRLGFTRAIVLLEEGCEEFSNIQGLGQIRFPAGNIGAVFEEIRRVLEREGVVATP